VVHHRGNDTIHPVENEIVAVNLQYGLTDTILFDSKSLGIPMEFPLLKPMFRGDLYQGLQQLGSGDSATITVIADSFFLKTAALNAIPKFVEAGEPLFYHVKLINHQSRTEYDSVQKFKAKEHQRNEQFRIIEYLSDNQLNIQPDSSGLVFIPIHGGIGKLPDTGDMCQVFLEVRILEGDTMYSNFGDEAFDIEFGKKFDNAGFMLGLGKMKEGSTARFFVPSTIGVGVNGYDGVPGFTTLDYTVKFVQIRPLVVVQAERRKKSEEKKIQILKSKQKEPEIIKNYLQKNHILVDSTTSGLFIQQIKAGSGDSPTTGSSVTVNYVQYDFDGRVIASSYAKNELFTFVLGTNAVIKGWEEAVLKMHEGEKVHLVIPSKLGYGSRGRGKNNPPYSPLFFDLELVNIN
jgi:FKBP-type peptidyl-prolyl cis-trans isomerase